MADSKIVDLTEKTTAYYDDEVVLNDVENSNVDKKLAVSAFTGASGAALNVVCGNLTNRYYTMSLAGAQTFTAGTTSVDDALYFYPITISGPQTFNRLGVNVTTAVASATARCGIYEVNSSGAPGAKVADSGQLDCSSTGVKEGTIAVTLCGMYYIAAVINGATGNPGFTTIDVSDSFAGLATFYGTANATDDNYAQLYISSVGTSSALPDPAGTISGTDNGDYVRPHLRKV